MKRLYLITVKAFHVVTFPIRNFISLENFLIRFNFPLPQDVRVILCDGVPENNILKLMHDFWMPNYKTLVYFRARRCFRYKSLLS